MDNVSGLLWPGGEGVTRESAKLLCAGSSPAQASSRSLLLKATNEQAGMAEWFTQKT